MRRIDVKLFVAVVRPSASKLDSVMNGKILLLILKKKYRQTLSYAGFFISDIAYSRLKTILFIPKNLSFN